jgi:hypothetical protein
VEYGGYSEEDLVSNRAALLLYGGNEAERRAWAHEAAGHFAGEGPLVEIRSPQELSGPLGRARGVVFISDALALGLEAQSQILRCLQEREERPKIIIALPRLPDEALQQGLLRDDLSYRLRLARVNLDAEGLGEVLQERRRKLEERLAAAKELVQARPSKKAKAAVASRRKGAASRKRQSNRSRRARPTRKRSARGSRRASKKVRSVKKSGKKRR